MVELSCCLWLGVLLQNGAVKQFALRYIQAKPVQLIARAQASWRVVVEIPCPTAPSSSEIGKDASGSH